MRTQYTKSFGYCTSPCFKKESFISTTIKKQWGTGSGKRWDDSFTEDIFRGLAGRDEDKTETLLQRFSAFQCQVCFSKGNETEGNTYS